MDSESADSYLVDEIRKGSQAAWRQLIERYQGRLLAFARTRTPSLADAVMLLYMVLRNGHDVTATLMSIKNDAGTVIAKGTLSDDGTTFVKAKLVSGA